MYLPWKLEDNFCKKKSENKKSANFDEESSKK